MQLYLYQNDQQVGPYTESQIKEMVAAGSIQETDICWHEGLSDWQPLNAAVISFAQIHSPSAPTVTLQLSEAVANTTVVQTNVKQGAVIGGSICFTIGFILMIVSLWSFFIYGPLFLVAFILSIVAMSQRRILGGILLLLCTLILPAVVGTVLFLTRTAKVLDDVSSAVQKSAATSRAALDTQRDETSRKIFAELRERKALYEDKLSKLESFRVLDAKLYKDKNSFSMGNTIELTVQNDTALPVSRAYFRAVYASPGRSIAWVEDTFNYQIPGGLEPGEKSTWKLLLP